MKTHIFGRAGLGAGLGCTAIVPWRASLARPERASKSARISGKQRQGRAARQDERTGREVLPKRDVNI